MKRPHRKPVLWLLYLLLFTRWNTISTSYQSQENHLQLLENFDYDEIDVRPQGQGEPFPVQVNLNIKDITNVDETRHSFFLDFMLTISWWALKSREPNECVCVCSFLAPKFRPHSCGKVRVGWEHLPELPLSHPLPVTRPSGPRNHMHFLHMFSGVRPPGQSETLSGIKDLFRCFVRWENSKTIFSQRSWLGQKASANLRFQE